MTRLSRTYLAQVDALKKYRAITFQLAEVSVSGNLFNRILTAIHRLRAHSVPG